MSSFTDPHIAAIDNAMTGLEPCMQEFCRSHEFAMTRSHEGSFNVPRRWLQRESAGIRQEIGLVIAFPMQERLARGFYSAIPCKLYIAAFDRAAQRQYSANVFDGEPFHCLEHSLRSYLSDAMAKLNACTPEFILRHGTHDLNL